jgi:hypothetical protein
MKKKITLHMYRGEGGKIFEFDNDEKSCDGFIKNPLSLDYLGSREIEVDDGRVTKPRETFKTWYLEVYKDDRSTYHVVSNVPFEIPHERRPYHEVISVIEGNPGDIAISKVKLAAAWDKMVRYDASNAGYVKAAMSRSFREIWNALELK